MQKGRGRGRTEPAAAAAAVRVEGSLPFPCTGAPPPTGRPLLSEVRQPAADPAAAPAGFSTATFPPAALPAPSSESGAPTLQRRPGWSRRWTEAALPGSARSALLGAAGEGAFALQAGGLAGCSESAPLPVGDPEPDGVALPPGGALAKEGKRHRATFPASPSPASGLPRR